MQPTSYAGDESWEQADLTDARFDPLIVLNPEAAPESDWAQHVDAGDREAAAKAFVELLRTGPARIDLEESIPAIRLRWFGTPINKISSEGFDPDDLVNLRYTGTYGITHQFEGEIDWRHDGSDGATPEWTWQLNRHFHWIDLADAYRESDDSKYARAWEKELRSWIEQCPRPDHEGREHGSPWRTLDTGIRAGSSWPYVFEIFRQSPHVSDEAIWLMFCAQRENALHLEKYPTGGNWKIMESNGLGHVGFMFPEMTGASAFADAAVERHQEEIDVQFFPDGTHQEFAPHYAAAGCITNFYALASIAEQSGTELSSDFRESLALMVSALARIADPDGIAPPIHNSHVIDTKNIFADVAAGHGREPPWTQAKSDLLPYGGYSVFRRKDSYAMFDAGPRGTSHYHDDDLQLLTYAHGRHFTIDSGCPNYTNEPISRHLRSSAAHNVVLMDGALQEPAIEIPRPEEPMPISFHGTDAVQVGAARRTLVQLEGGSTFDHERIVLDVDGLGWVVLDRLFPPDDQPHTWEWIWNLAVDSVATKNSSAQATYDNGPSMILASASNAAGEFTTVKGQEDPLRGWTNTRESVDYLPIHAVRYVTEPHAGTVWAVTLKAPFSEEASIEDALVKASEENGDTWMVTAARGQDSWQFRLTGDDEIHQVDAWKNGDPLNSVSTGGHTLRE